MTACRKSQSGLRTFHVIPRYLPRYWSAGGALLIAQLADQNILRVTHETETVAKSLAR